MTKTQVVAWLKANQDERGIAHWNKRFSKGSGLKAYGMGLTPLRKFAKQIGRNPQLAATLWKTDIYEAKILGLLIDDPKQMTREQAEAQVEQLQGGYLTHVFSSCDATLAKTPFAFELSVEWMKSKDPVRRRCGYGLLYELTRKNPKGMTEEFLLERIDWILRKIHKEEMWVRDAMLTALMGMGKRSPVLNQAAIFAAEQIGPVEIDYGEGNSCEPIDVLKHLQSPALKKRLGL